MTCEKSIRINQMMSFPVYGGVTYIDWKMYFAIWTTKIAYSAQK